MRRTVLLMHVSLDGFVAGPNGELDWIKLSDDLGDEVRAITDGADAALYGANTYRMMASYWPTAAQRPHATKHDIDHWRWANRSQKFVFSTRMQETNWSNTTIIRDNAAEELLKLKSQPGRDLLMLGSPTLAKSLMRLGLIDEFHFNVHPVALGSGIAMFDDLDGYFNLDLVETKVFSTDVVGLHYRKPLKGVR